MTWPWRRGRREVYDLIADPNERRNLLGSRDGPAGLPARFADLEAWSERTPSTPAAGPERDPEVLERLRSLGYVD